MQYVEFFAARHDTGAAIPNAKVNVYLTGTTMPASIYDIAGASLPNPMTATIDGLAGIAAANGSYDIQFQSADGSYLSPTIHRVQFYDLAGIDAIIAADIAAATKAVTISASRYQVKYDGTGTANPSTQTNTFTATKKNTTAIVTWTIADLGGSPVTPASTYLSAATGDSVTMSRVNFDGARGSTQGVVVTGTATDGATYSGSVTVVVNQDGSAGTTGKHWYGLGLPANNLGSDGDDYTDTSTGIVYGQKTSGTWALGAIVDVNAATPGRARIDLRGVGATLPTTQATVTRNSASTDMLPSDPYTYVPNFFSANTPVIRVGKGLIGSGARAQQLLSAPGAPVVETVTVVTGSIVCVTAWGPPGSTYTSAPGSTGGAVGTGFGALAGDAGVAQFITITTGGTITLTPSGGIAKANVQNNPSLLTGTEAVPYIASQSIREADQIIMGSALIAALGSSQGHFLMGISDANPRNFGAPPCLLGLNNLPAWFLTSLTAMSVDDPGGHITNMSSLGSGNFKTGVTIGRTWDTSATVTFGGGDKLEVSHPFQHNNGVTVTSGSLLGAKSSGTNTSGQQGITACLGWWEYGTGVRLSDEALYAAYTSLKLPTIDDFLRNYDGAPQFPKFLDAMRRMNAGTIDHVRIADYGSSHHAGTSSIATNVRVCSTTAQMVVDLKAEGVYPVNDDFFTGVQSYGFAAGTSPFDARLTYVGTAPNGVLNQTGVVVIRIPAGTTLTFTPALNSAKFSLAYYTGSGYGSLEVSKDGGTTPIVPDEGGSATISTNAASSIQLRHFSAILGTNAWTMKAVGAAVDIAFGYAYNPAAKQIVFGNLACYGYTTVGLSLDASPEQSVLLPLRTFAPDLSLGCTDDTNSMSPLLTQSAFTTGAGTILASLTPTADVILYTDPPSDLSFVSQATQNTIYGYDRAVARANYLPIFDFAAWGQAWVRLPSGFYDDSKHLTKRAIKRLKSNQQKALFKRIMSLV
jgi:hypothetical protein